MAEDIFSIPVVPKKRIGISGTESSPAPHSEPSISSAKSDTGSHPTVGTDSNEYPAPNVGDDILQTASTTVKAEHTRRAQQIPSTNHTQTTEIGPKAQRDEEENTGSRTVGADVTPGEQIDSNPQNANPNLASPTNRRRRPRKISKSQEQTIIELRRHGLPYSKIANRLGLRACGVWALMKRRGLTGRKKTRPITRELLQELYWNQGLSRLRIAKGIGMPKTNVEYWMKKHGIPSRSLLKYPRHPFDGGVCEKAYMLGLRGGDLYARRLGHGVSLSTTTTHPAMLELFQKTFERYGHIYTHPVYNRESNEYQWIVRVTLDDSFSFLLQPLNELPRWIIQDSSSFLHFLAGFFDAEGTISIVFRERFGGKYVQPTTSISNTNKQVLREIASMMGEYHPRFELSKKGGTATSRHGRIRKNDQWNITVSRRAAQEKLITELPIRHQEKLERANLLTDIWNGCSWEDAKKRLETMRQKFREDVDRLAQLAARRLRETNESH